MSETTETKIVYLDGIDWQHHIPDDASGVKVYGSVDNVFEGNACLKKGGGCGIVKVEMKLISWVVPQDLDQEKGTSDDHNKN